MITSPFSARNDRSSRLHSTIQTSPQRPAKEARTRCAIKPSGAGGVEDSETSSECLPRGRGLSSVSLEPASMACPGGPLRDRRQHATMSYVVTLCRRGKVVADCWKGSQGWLGNGHHCSCIPALPVEVSASSADRALIIHTNECVRQKYLNEMLCNARGRLKIRRKRSRRSRGIVSRHPPIIDGRGISGWLHRMQMTLPDLSERHCH